MYPTFGNHRIYRKCTECGTTAFGRNRMSAESANLSTFGTESETEAEIRSTSTCIYSKYSWCQPAGRSSIPLTDEAPKTHVHKGAMQYMHREALVSRTRSSRPLLLVNTYRHLFRYRDTRDTSHLCLINNAKLIISVDFID